MHIPNKHFCGEKRRCMVATRRKKECRFFSGSTNILSFAGNPKCVQTPLGDPERGSSSQDGEREAILL